jgi:hypothetical protein
MRGASWLMLGLVTALGCRGGASSPARPVSTATVSPSSSAAHADAQSRQRCATAEANLSPRHAALRDNPAAADLGEFAALFQDCRGELSPETRALVASWKPMAFAASDDASERAWKLLAAYAESSISNPDARQLLKELSASAYNRVSQPNVPGALRALWFGRSARAMAKTIIAGVPSVEIEQAALGLQNWPPLDSPEDVAVPDGLARCATLLDARAPTRFVCAGSAGEGYRRLWKAGHCPDCATLAYANLRVVMEQQSQADASYQLFGDTWVQLLIEMKRFTEANTWINRLLSEPKYRGRGAAHHRLLQVAGLSPDAVGEPLYALRSQAAYAEGLELKARGEYGQCAQKLAGLSHDANLRALRPQLLITLGDCYEALRDYPRADQAWFDAAGYDPDVKPQVDERHQRRPDTGTARVMPFGSD